MIRRLLDLSFLQSKVDLGLLLARVGIGMNLFLRHGYEKVVTFSFHHHFSDDIGLGAAPSFLIAFCGDAICALLLVLGLCTRWSALFCFGVIAVGWGAHHHFLYKDLPGLHLSGDHGELCVTYLVAMLLFLFAGPGRYSLDTLIARWIKRNQ